MTINLSHDKNYLQCGVIMSDNIFINHLNHIHGNFLTDLLVKITLMNNFAGPTTRRCEECLRVESDRTTELHRFIGCKSHQSWLMIILHWTQCFTRERRLMGESANTFTTEIKVEWLPCDEREVDFSLVLWKTLLWPAYMRVSFMDV